MSYKLSDFSIGPVGFFSIIMPGSLSAFVLLRFHSSLFGEGSPLPALEGIAQQWIAFAISAYVLGHILIEFGNAMDKHVWFEFYVRKWKHRKGDDKLLVLTQTIVGNTLGEGPGIEELFNWAGSLVRIKSLTATTEVDRLSAESKFFRSLSLVSILVFLTSSADARLDWAVGSAFLCVFSFWRYFGLRWDVFQRTFEYFVILSRVEKTIE